MSGLSATEATVSSRRVRLSRADRNWLTWLLMTVGSFAWLETCALRSNEPGLTLSATIRRWLGVSPRHKGKNLLSIGFLGFLAWLGTHIMHAPKGST